MVVYKLEEEKHRQLRMFVVLWKKWKKLASSSINQSVTEDTDFGKKNHFFIWSSFWSWRVCKQPTENPQAYVEKLTHPKRVTVWCGFWSRGIIRKWARSGRYSQWQSLSGNAERIFVHKCWRGGYWQHLLLTGWHYSRSYRRRFALWASIWYRCTIICRVPWKMSATPTSQT